MRILAWTFMIFFIGMGAASAHHPGHMVSSGTSIPLQGAKQAKPSTRAYLSYGLSGLDNGIGNIHALNLGGEYSFASRFSAGLDLPLSLIDRDLMADQRGCGDLRLGARFLLWDGKKTFSALSSGVSLPTGSDNSGLGRGAVGQDLSWLLALRQRHWIGYVSLGSSWGYESQSEPVVELVTGGNSPQIANSHVEFGLSLLGQIFADSSVFQSGSAKIYAQPEIRYSPDRFERLMISAGGRVSLWDGLERRSGIVLTASSAALLNDVDYTVTTTMNVKFK